MMRCTGCGSTETLAEIRAKNPEAISCCPERKLKSVCKSCDADTEEWWNYCAMCGYHIAGNNWGPV
jgi:hypothetical protein